MALERRDVEEKYKWDLSVIYKTEEDFNSDLKLAEGKIKAYGKHEGRITNSPEALAKALSDMFEIEMIISKLWRYAYLSFAVDTSDNKAQALTSRVRSLAVSAGSASWFVRPYILKLDEDTVREWIGSPELKTYARYIERTLADKPHTLSDECERLMTKMEDCLGTHTEIRGILTDSDLRFGKIRNEEGKLVELTDANYGVYLRSLDRRVRASAFRMMYKTYGQLANTYATMYSGRVKEAITTSALRGFKSSLEASTHQDEVTPEIYYNLIKTVENNLPPLYDYYALKRELLGVEKLHLYDIYTPLVGSLKKTCTYEEAARDVLDTCRIFGEEYHGVMSAGLGEKRWVDVYPTRGKRGGAFATAGAGTDPFILLNFNGSYDDVSTLAHEGGHAMHTYFANKYNEPHNAEYTIFVAEVASTVNELLLAHKKLRESKSDEEKLYILDGLMETYKATLYRQTMFASFEAKMHALLEAGTPLTRDLMCREYYKLVKKYFGRDVVCDKDIALEWARIPHFYSCFYVYKYSTCISAASAIVKRIETEGEAYVSRYIDFLKCGGSKSPLESLLVAGIDMRDGRVISDAIEDFKNSVAEFREIYEKNRK